MQNHDSDCNQTVRPCGCGKSAQGNGVLLEMARRIKSIEKLVVDYIAENPSNQTGEGGNGKSSYELWLDAGGVGTVADFLKSLRGPGAYEIYLENGGKGSPQDFLNSLKGELGASAYKIWQLAGNFGSEQDFLNSLKGRDGDPGQGGQITPEQQKVLQLAPSTAWVKITDPISGTVERYHGLGGEVYCLVQNIYGGIELSVGAVAARDSQGQLKSNYFSITVPPGETYVGSVIVMLIKNQLT